jgi:UDP-N-acetylmuramate dehydrogenase
MKPASTSLSGLFQDSPKRPLRRRVSLRLHSSFRIGGPADHFFEARSLKEMKDCLRFARETTLPYYVVGAGTNMLFADSGFRGLILKNRVRGIARGREADQVVALAGTPLADLVSFALEEGLEGIEFAAGIPGTTGGAIFGNAGAWGLSIGQLVEEALIHR